MTTKVVNVIKQGCAILLLSIGLLSCESEIEEVGVNIVDNDIFKTDRITSDVITYNQNIERRLANNLGNYLLGVYRNEDFGQLDATIISQLTFNSPIDFGEDPYIDSVVVNIPYYSANIGTYDNGSPKFEIDSIIGNSNVSYNLKVHELETYLNTLDPSDPSKPLDYYTDESYDFNPTPLFSDLFVPNEKDTVMYIYRSEVIADPDNGIYKIDTIKNVNASPTLKIPLNKQFFTDNFLTNPEAFESLEAFVQFFNGLYIEASSGVNPAASVVSLGLENATMTIFHTNTEFGIRTAQTAHFLFGGVNNSKYTRNYSGSNAEPYINNPDVVFGDELLYTQGAAGSMALVELFINDDLEELRNRNLLINNANLVFYVDQNSDLSIVPNRMFLYNYDDDRQLPDLLLDGLSTYDGALELDENDVPFRYNINITDYISRVLSFKDPIELSTLGLKVMNVSDLPTGILDFKVDDYSWNPKGVVIHGNNSPVIEKRIELEISFTELNQ